MIIRSVIGNYSVRRRLIRSLFSRYVNLRTLTSSLIFSSLFFFIAIRHWERKEKVLRKKRINIFYLVFVLFKRYK